MKISKLIISLIIISSLNPLSLACYIEKPNEYTGLVIDAKGLDVMPGMSPKIFDASGREIYGTMEIDPDTVIERGILGYVDSQQEAIEDGLVGENPIVVRALSRSPEPAKTCVIISKEDGDKVLSENIKSGFLGRLKVAIIR